MPYLLYFHSQADPDSSGNLKLLRTHNYKIAYSGPLLRTVLSVLLPHLKPLGSLERYFEKICQAASPSLKVAEKSHDLCMARSKTRVRFLGCYGSIIKFSSNKVSFYS